MKEKTHIECRDFERLAVFYVCEELSASEREAVEQHAAACPACAAVLERERELLEGVAERKWEEPSSLLLAQCREELAEALDSEESTGSWKEWLEAIRPSRWLVAHPAWGAALLLLVGISLGQVVPQWVRRATAPAPPNPEMTVYGLGEQDLRGIGVSGVQWVPGSSAESPNVELQMRAERPMVVRGSVDDADVKRVLMFVVKNGQRFDSGVRLDSVEVLRTRSQDEEVRQALCLAARQDRNPGVRLKALEALRGFGDDAEVRQAVLDALLRDENPGVRVEAINALRAMAEQGTIESDSLVVDVLRDRMQRDPNTYIRMQSAAAVRQLQPRSVH